MTLHIETDSAYGGRVSSIRDASGFEWLWSRPDAGRFKVAAGDAFVDIGGGEECYPTISGIPDHGEVWSVAWADDAGWLRVEAPSGVLRRRVVPTDDGARFEYRLEADPGFKFIWALHALLRPEAGTRLRVPGRPVVHCWTEGDDKPAVLTTWPVPDVGPDLRVLVADDGTARFVAVETSEIDVLSPSGKALRFALDCEDQPHAMGVWRNLGGYPGAGATYRSFAVEPMLGTHHYLAHARDVELATVPADGTVSWNVTLVEL